MASHIGLAYRADGAMTRIAAAYDAIRASGTIDLPDAPQQTRDPLENSTLRLEWLADVLECVESGAKRVTPTRARKAEGAA